MTQLEPPHFSLMAGQEPTPCPQAIDGKHKWVIIDRPLNNRSGYHKERCELCGATCDYDTSD